jgi:hypothetical protein
VLNPELKLNLKLKLGGTGGGGAGMGRESKNVKQICATISSTKRDL